MRNRNQIECFGFCLFLIFIFRLCLQSTFLQHEFFQEMWSKLTYDWCLRRHRRSSLITGRENEERQNEASPQAALPLSTCKIKHERVKRTSQELPAAVWLTDRLASKTGGDVIVIVRSGERQSESEREREKRRKTFNPLNPRHTSEVLCLQVCSLALSLSLRFIIRSNRIVSSPVRYRWPFSLLLIVVSIQRRIFKRFYCVLKNNTFVLFFSNM